MAKKSAKKEIKWVLSDIIKSDVEFNFFIQDVKKDVKRLLDFKNKLSPDMSEQDFKKLLLLEEEIGEKTIRLSHYVHLLSSGDLKSQKVMKYSSILEKLDIEISDQTRFIGHWVIGKQVEGLKQLDDENAKRLFKVIPSLEYSLNYSRLREKHVLKESEEKIIHRKDMSGIDIVSELYDKIVNDFEFSFKVKGKKPRIIKTQEEITKFVFSQKKEERKAAYQALFEAYSKHKEKLFTIYSAIVKNWATAVELRNYNSPINIRNFSNQTSDKAVDVLQESCTSNKKVFMDFFKLKAKLLGMKKLKRYDLYAPLPKKGKGKTYTYEQAKKLIFDVFEVFDKDFKDKAVTMVNSNHIDVFPRENKVGGAYCSAVTSKIIPYVLLNFVGTLRSVTTFAHELGHAIHFLYASKQPTSVLQAPLTLCETASTFCELLLFERLLEQASKKEKIELLVEKISDDYATILRQNYFVLFEREAHKRIVDDNITEEELTELYHKMNKEQFGDAIDLNDEFKYEWSYIPHIFHSPFYCYAYSFGKLLTLALFAEYKKQGKSFIEKIKNVLSAGNSENPEVLLKNIGIDVTKKEFWNSGFSIIKSWVEELKELVK